MKKMIFATFIVVILISSSVPALAENFERAIFMVADVVVMRPVGLACIVVGTAAYVVTLPVALSSGSVKPVTRTLVTSPFEFTFKRPVGDFSSWE
jgi:hypothetical protein